MKWRDLVIDGYGRVLEVIVPALDGMEPAELDKRLKPDTNSMGLIVWHLARVQDAQIADLMGEEQLWTTEGWYNRFKRARDPSDTGFGHTSEEVGDFRSPTAGTLLEYCRAVIERSQQYLRVLPTDELVRELDEPWYKPLPTVGVRIVSIMADCLEHAGEVAYLRGLLTGKGWLDV